MTADGPRPLAADRRLRLRRRRAHRAARVPRLAARGGLPLPRRRRRAFPTGRRRDDELRECVRAQHRFLLDRGAKLIVIACNSAASAGLEAAREVAAERGVEVVAGDRARGRDRGRDHRHRAGSGCSRRRRRSTAAPTCGRSRASTASSTVTQVAAPDLAAIIQRGFPFSEEVVETGALLLRAAEARRGRHRDPRLHPLPAGRADAAADPRPRRAPGHRRPRARRHRPADPRGARARRRAATARATTASSAPATPTPFRELGTRFLQLPLGEVEQVELPELSARAATLSADDRDASSSRSRPTPATAMKAGERDRVGALRMVADALQKDAKDGGDDEVAVLQRERKSGSRPPRPTATAAATSSAAAEEAEARADRGATCPQQLSDEELARAGRRGDRRDRRRPSTSEMGKVMAPLMPKVGGRADGKRVSAAVREQARGLSLARRQLTLDNTVAAELAGSEDAVLRELEGSLGCDALPARQRAHPRRRRRRRAAARRRWSTSWSA